MKGIVEKGIVYKRSRISYMLNYFILILFTIFFILLLPNIMDFFGIIEFKPTFMIKTHDEFISTMLVFAFLIPATFLIEEPTIEQMIRRYIVTNSEIIKREGLIRKKEYMIPHNMIAGVTVDRGIVGRIFDYGTVHIMALGKMEQIDMKGMKNPDEVSRIIKHKISIFKKPSKK